MSAINGRIFKTIQRSEIKKQKNIEIAKKEKRIVAFNIGEQIFLAHPSGDISGPFKKVPNFSDKIIFNGKEINQEQSKVIIKPEQVTIKEEIKTEEITIKEEIESEKIEACSICGNLEDLKICYKRIGFGKYDDKEILVCNNCRKEKKGQYKFKK